MPTTTTTPQAPVSAERQPVLRTGEPPLVSLLTIPGHARHARTAREFIALMLGAHSWPDEGVADLLVSEIVANSVRHSESGQPGGTITVTVTTTPGQFLVEVMDHGGAGDPVVRPASDGDDAENGRGLRLVADLAADWGYYRLRDRLITWFELPITQLPTTER
jgi:anti-sigma regulatory factor (Ser/Thr protein kinase)